MRRRTGFLIGILFELLAVFGLFAPYALLATKGEEIILETVPIDPRSVFRGDYVMLGYKAGSNVPFADVSTPHDGLQSTVYVILAKKGEVYERVGVSLTQPVLSENQVCLRGSTQGFFSDLPQPVTITFPDLAQYFVEEDLGRELESARNAHRLLVRAAVSPSCTAVIKGIVLGPEVPQSEFPTDTRREPIAPVM